MTKIELSTAIDAPLERCFDLARNVDFHKLSVANTNEEAVAGRTSGLCELGDRITWEATHFGIRQRLSVEITKFEKPYFFEDTMTKGAFKSMRHEHHFSFENGLTVMKDEFYFEAPFGIIGKIFNALILKKYMMTFLLQRNALLKELAEKDTSIK
ncbi:SRPBCC family protein [Flavobacterium sp. SE-s28]|uniref:SRPBCC family protein n=1 Tax=Flavobacterium silvaticum TaxID=1852020 RepID=A0A972FM82_9FLAO|nr:SRPBCC family protein [Flavobacterium silvaticum]NMH28247.1 SRPBCC family protein [Flavobacterium silvaticum]